MLLFEARRFFNLVFRVAVFGNFLDFSIHRPRSGCQDFGGRAMVRGEGGKGLLLSLSLCLSLAKQLIRELEQIERYYSSKDTRKIMFDRRFHYFADPAQSYLTPI